MSIDTFLFLFSTTAVLKIFEIYLVNGILEETRIKYGKSVFLPYNFQPDSKRLEAFTPAD